MNVVITLFCISEVALRSVLEVSCVRRMKHECRRYIAFCIQEVAPSIVLDIACTE